MIKKFNTTKNSIPTIFLKMFFCMLFIYILLNLMPPAISQGKTKKPAFENKYNTIYTGKTYKYNIVNAPKNCSIKFTTNNKKLATINSKSGILSSKKKGTVTLKAFITHKKTSKITLKKTITIKQSSVNYANNNLQSPSTYINSISYTVRLKSLKIMQLSDVKSSHIYLTKDSNIIYGTFKKLSTDGKYITYEFDNNSIKLLTPGDKSMDGNYEMSCSLSSNKFKIKYMEHITGQSVTGFVLTPSGKPLNNTQITLSNDNFSVKSTTDKNGYYNIRFPKPETVKMTVTNDKYYTRTFENIYLKFVKAVCKNVIMHEINNAENTTDFLTAYFKIKSYDNKPVRVELISKDINNIKTTDSSLDTDSIIDTDTNFTPDKQSQSNSHTFTTDDNGNLILSASPTSLPAETPADIVTISSTENKISHSKQVLISAASKECFNFSYEPLYHIKIYSSSNSGNIPDNEFYFSFNDFLTKHIIFNITLTPIEKTAFSKTLLPINTGSNVNFEDINYYQASIYQIGYAQPICSFNFKENTPADFNYQINASNLHLNSGNNYYAIFNISDYNDNNLALKTVLRFEVKNNKIYFEKDSVSFTDEETFQNEYKQLPKISDLILNFSLLKHDDTCIDTVLCKFNNYGAISKVLLTSLSSPLLQKELSKSSSGYMLYTDNDTFNLNISSTK